MMWNYRIVKTTDEVTKEPTYEICEVYYNAIGKPTGFCSVKLLGDTIEELKSVLEMLGSAYEKPFIRSTDFK